MNEKATRKNRFKRLRPWLVFLAIALLFAIFEWGVEAAGRRSEARQTRDDDIRNEIWWKMRNYAHWSALPALEKKFNGGRALPRQAIFNNIGSAERVVVDVWRLGAAYAGWHVRLDYANPGRAAPPARSGTGPICTGDRASGCLIRCPRHCSRVRRRVWIRKWPSVTSNSSSSPNRPAGREGRAGKAT
jgi:hypothetical protein